MKFDASEVGAVLMSCRQGGSQKALDQAGTSPCPVVGGAGYPLYFWGGGQGHFPGAAADRVSPGSAGSAVAPDGQSCTGRTTGAMGKRLRCLPGGSAVGLSTRGLSGGVVDASGRS